MGLGTKIVSGSALALKFAKSILGMPSLTNEDPTQGPVFSVPLDIESHSQEGSAEVSESLIITDNKKKFISDNISPGSWSWDISGFIPGSPAEITNFYTPVVTKHLEILRTWYKMGTPLVYKDVDRTIYKNVAIKRFNTTFMADTKNEQPFSMTLKEMNIMNSAFDSISAATPALGTVLGKSLDAGSVVAAVSVWMGATVASAGLEKIATNMEDIDFPEMQVTENFTFNATVSAGTVTFQFKWINNKWNCWVTLPDKSVRAAGVIPNTTNWTGMSDYGLRFETSLQNISKEDITNTKIVFITW